MTLWLVDLKKKFKTELPDLSGRVQRDEKKKKNKGSRDHESNAFIAKIYEDCVYSGSYGGSGTVVCWDDVLGFHLFGALNDDLSA